MPVTALAACTAADRQHVVNRAVRSYRCLAAGCADWLPVAPFVHIVALPLAAPACCRSLCSVTSLPCRCLLPVAPTVHLAVVELAAPACCRPFVCRLLPVRCCPLLLTAAADCCCLLLTAAGWLLLLLPPIAGASRRRLLLLSLAAGCYCLSLTTLSVKSLPHVTGCCFSLLPQVTGCDCCRLLA